MPSDWTILIHLEKWEGKERSGEPPGSNSRRKAFVHPESLHGKSAEWGISSGPETSPASLKCRDGANRSACASVLYPSSSPAHRWLWMFFWTRAFLLNLWNGDNVFFLFPCMQFAFYNPSFYWVLLQCVACSLPQEQGAVGLMQFYCW